MRTVRGLFLRRRSMLLGAALSLTVLAGAATEALGQTDAPKGPSQRWAKAGAVRTRALVVAEDPAPRILVKLAHPDRPLSATVDLDALGFREVGAIPQLHVVKLEAIRPLSSDEVTQAVSALRAQPGVLRAELDGTLFTNLVPDDQYYSEQWAPAAVNLPAAWDITTGSEDVVIAVIDTGITREVRDFADRIVAPYSIAYQSAEWPAWEDIVGHGTAVAGVAAAEGDNGFGMAGAAWGPRIMPVHVSDSNQTDDSLLAEGIVYAVDNGADVINISMGQHAKVGVIGDAVDYALGKGVTIVAAAGNEGPGVGVTYPAAYPGVIAVGASDSRNTRASFSCTGPDLDLVAPGTNIFTWWTDTTSYWLESQEGTSFAAPLVAGTVALMLSQNPELGPDQVEELLRSTALDLGAPGWDGEYGGGLLDAARAVAESTAGVVDEFSDVGVAHPYHTAILGLARAGLITGYAERQFRPSNPVWRAQFAKMIDGTLGIAVSEGMTSPFTDLGPDDPDSPYPHEYVAAAFASGITQGLSPTTFGPFRDISRAQVVTMAVRALQNLRPGSLATPPSGWEGSVPDFSAVHGPSVRLAEYNGLFEGLVGLSAGWDPWVPASRGEVAQVLWNIYQRDML